MKYDLKEASKVSVGDYILTISGEEEVTFNNVVSEKGIYTIVVQEEYVVVNDIVASPFATNHFIPNLFYTIHRSIYSFMPNALKSNFFNSVGTVADEVSQV